MLRVLNRHDWRVKGLLASQGLASSDFLGKGCFALTYQTREPGRVIKLTTDRVTVSYLSDYTAPQGIHVPRVFGDIDIVGQIEDLDVYRIDMERLRPLPRGGTNRRIARHLWTTFYGWRPLSDEVNKDEAFAGLPGSVQEFLHRLAWFGENYQDVGLDLQPSNFMERADGTLVFADPVCDLKVVRGLNDQARDCSRQLRWSGRAFYRARVH